MAKIRVTITKVLEDWWGAEDFLADYEDRAEALAALVELLYEDIGAAVEDAEFSFEVVEEEETNDSE